MWNLFGKNKPPINEESRVWLEEAFLWLCTEFGEEAIRTRKVLIPTPQDFPIKYDNSISSAHKTLEIVAEAMEIDHKKIELNFFDQGIKEIQSGGDNMILTEFANNKTAAGFYTGKNKKGKFEIAIDQNLLKTPPRLVATISHELSHIKLLGENRIKHNDEHLTDFITIVFGLGVFNANSSFEFIKTSDRWGYNSLGYFTQQEWAYALALFVILRKEEFPEWGNYLNKTTKNDLKKALEFIKTNR